MSIAPNKVIQTYFVDFEQNNIEDINLFCVSGFSDVNIKLTYRVIG
jgi:hypothetical protein